jgi:hypothetical protein
MPSEPSLEPTLGCQCDDCTYDRPCINVGEHARVQLGRRVADNARLSGIVDSLAARLSKRVMECDCDPPCVACQNDNRAIREAWPNG